MNAADRITAERVEELIIKAEASAHGYYPTDGLCAGDIPDLVAILREHKAQMRAGGKHPVNVDLGGPERPGVAAPNVPGPSSPGASEEQRREMAARLDGALTAAAIGYAHMNIGPAEAKKRIDENGKALRALAQPKKVIFNLAWFEALVSRLILADQTDESIGQILRDRFREQGIEVEGEKS